MHGTGGMAVVLALLVIAAFVAIYYDHNTPDRLVVISVDPAAHTMLVSDRKIVVHVEYCGDPPSLGLRSLCFDQVRRCAVQQTTYCDGDMVGAITLFGG